MRKRWLGFDSSFTPLPPPLKLLNLLLLVPQKSTMSSRCSSLFIVCILVDGLDHLHLHPLHPLVDSEAPPSLQQLINGKQVELLPPPFFYVVFLKNESVASPFSCSCSVLLEAEPIYC
jgi:hypothetical protein